MELIDALQQVIQQSQHALQPCDLRIGTVVSQTPLRISINTSMAPLGPGVLYLTEPVVEKKIPIVEHSHTLTLTGMAHFHTVSGLGHSHDFQVAAGGTETGGTPGQTVSGQTENALTGTYATSTALENTQMEGFSTDTRLGHIVCYEHGKALPVEDGYIILNRALETGDKVLLLRVQKGQKFIVLSRVFEVS